MWWSLHINKMCVYVRARVCLFFSTYWVLLSISGCLTIINFIDFIYNNKWYYGCTGILHYHITFTTISQSSDNMLTYLTAGFLWDVLFLLLVSASVVSVTSGCDWATWTHENTCQSSTAGVTPAILFPDLLLFTYKAQLPTDEAILLRRIAGKYWFVNYFCTDCFIQLII